MTGVIVHRVGAGEEEDLVERAEDFGRRVAAAIRRDRRGEREELVVLGHEWSSIPALLELEGEAGSQCLLSLMSLERQRSDMSSELSRRIEDVERRGLGRARTVLVQDGATAEQARALEPGCAERIVYRHHAFPVEEYESSLDPGEVKARYQVGPVDFTILFIGDLDERHGPDLLVRAMPAILKNHPQARLIIVGDGVMMWPLKVMSRYMLLDHAVRLVGHVGGREAKELIAAADIIVVPSRTRTEDWGILSGWAARRPVVATHQVGEGMCRHEEDCVMVYANPGSLVWGVERVLFDPDLGRRIAERGRARVEELFGWGRVGEQLDGLTEARPS